MSEDVKVEQGSMNLGSERRRILKQGIDYDDSNC